jgi:hypothetical protein
MKTTLGFIFILAGVAFCLNDLKIQPAFSKETVVKYVLLESDTLYKVVEQDSLTAAREIIQVQKQIEKAIEVARNPQAIQLREQNGAGIIMIDSVDILTVRTPNRVRSDLSPLANALFIRESVIRYSSKYMIYGEEELLLRLLMGIVYPFLLLVMLRLTRTGLRRWEKGWRNAAMQWLNKFAQRRGIAESRMQSRKLLGQLLGIERFIVFGTLIIIISFFWFALFPQTQPLAAQLIASVVNPVLSLVGHVVKGFLMIVYSIFVFLGAYWLSRKLSQKRKLKSLTGVFADPVVYFPFRIIIWILALFLFFFPYPGAPRLFSVGMLLIALLTVLIALRPLIEEVVIGIYLSTNYSLKKDDEVTIDNVAYRIVDTGLIHVHLRRDDITSIMAYSKLMKTQISFTPEYRAKNV